MAAIFKITKFKLKFHQKLNWHIKNTSNNINKDSELDVDEDGLISADDLLSIFEGLERKDIMDIIDEVDLDMDGTIKLNEYITTISISGKRRCLYILILCA